MAIIRDEVPTEWQGEEGLARRRYTRGALSEFRFYYRDPRPRLPIIRDGQFKLARWGNGRGQSRHLPRSGWTWASTLGDGTWTGSGAVTVTIAASFSLDGRGVWSPVFVGIRGVLVPDERGRAVAYMVCEPASPYYQTQTGSIRMPVFIDQQI